MRRHPTAFIASTCAALCLLSLVTYTNASIGPQLLHQRTVLQTSDAPSPSPPPPPTSIADEYDTHKPWVWDWQQILGIILSIIVSLASGPGGQGGASFYIPLFSVLLQFSVRAAAAMATFIVFLGCISAVIPAMLKDNPVTLHRAPMIDYTTLIVMMPPMLLGISFGVILNSVLANWLIDFLVIGVWLWSIWKMVRAYRRTHARETRALEKMKDRLEMKKENEKDSSLSPLSASQEVVVVGLKSNQHDDVSLPETTVSKKKRKSFSSYFKSFSKWMKDWWAIQPKKILCLVMLPFVVYVVCQIILGNESISPRCSATYWGILGGLAAFLALYVAAVSVWLVKKAKKDEEMIRAPTSHAGLSFKLSSSPTDLAGSEGNEKEEAGNSPQNRLREAIQTSMRLRLNEAAILWNSPKKIITTAPIMSLIGAFGGALGLGGAAFVSPILLDDGLHPKCAAATCKFILLISTCGASVAYLVMQKINITYGVVYGLINLCVTPIGVYAMDKVADRTGHPSYIIMIQIVRVAVGIIIQIAFSLVPSVNDLVKGTEPDAGFNPSGVCST
jgi:uncharacterized membrane protein YfcA